MRADAVVGCEKGQVFDERIGEPIGDDEPVERIARPALVQGLPDNPCKGSLGHAQADPSQQVGDDRFGGFRGASGEGEEVASSKSWPCRILVF